MEEKLSTAENEAKLVRVSNRLIEGEYKYVQCHLDVIFYLLSLVQEGQENYSFNVSAIQYLTGREYQCKELRDHMSVLAKLQYKISDIAGKKKRWAFYNLFQEISYDDGRLDISLTAKGLEVFLDTKSKFSFLELKTALMLSGKHSKRLYMIFAQWRNVGNVFFELDELKRKLDIEDSYDCNSTVRQLVERSVDNINEISNMNISCCWVKAGRKLNGVNFTIVKKDELAKRSKEQKALADSDKAKQSDINFQMPEEKGQALQLFKSYGFTETEAEEMWTRGCRAKDFNEIVERMKNAVAKMVKKEREKIVAKPIIYLRPCLKQAGFLADFDFSDPNHVHQKIAQDDFLARRNEYIEMIVKSVREGVPIEAFRLFMESYRITKDDLKI